ARTILAPTGCELIPQPTVPPRRSVGGLLRFWPKPPATAAPAPRARAAPKPAPALGLGGYAPGDPVRVRGPPDVPAAAPSPDALPGKANQYLMRYCRRLFCGSAATRARVPAEIRDRLVTVGCPLRREFADLPALDEAAGRLGLDPRLNTLVVT